MFTNRDGEVECENCGFAGGISEFGGSDDFDDEGDLVCPSCSEESPLVSHDDDGG